MTQKDVPTGLIKRQAYSLDLSRAVFFFESGFANECIPENSDVYTRAGLARPIETTEVIGEVGPSTLVS